MVGEVWGRVGEVGRGQEEGGVAGEQRGERVGHGQVLHRAGLENLARKEHISICHTYIGNMVSCAKKNTEIHIHLCCYHR